MKHKKAFIEWAGRFYSPEMFDENDAGYFKNPHTIELWLAWEAAIQHMKSLFKEKFYNNDEERHARAASIEKTNSYPQSFSEPRTIPCSMCGGVGTILIDFGKFVPKKSEGCPHCFGSGIDPRSTFTVDCR